MSCDHGDVSDEIGLPGAASPRHGTAGLSTLLERALRVAGTAHAGQHRKGTDIPYVVHPLAVVLILTRAGIDDDETLAAAILHDVVEDTDWTAERLQREFPPRVVELVAALSEQKTTSDGEPIPWETRKREHMQRLGASCSAARAIALADKLHNARSLLYDAEAGGVCWDRFNAPRDRILDRYREAAERLGGDEPPLARLVTELRETIDRLSAVD
ncbi:Bifunctional (p)ppGpp synthase/hydrolase relA [Maioricimonas rarisocia]|uniref:Bifunctional (P)ppGpp synthase/hydrolase relA n=1 Tax=Maioricimonas rarisocia TaxID=2528026 RepID=A0A517ZEZ5_9PLAN|nr:HD domain-containing protein [Maioricimonas rarisocia]QDU41009.1 Bifunctional (p)ppGpp synthase/hydrolase relA [Maioricimonas rarisocia]